jgi:hypothetical protein
MEGRVTKRNAVLVGLLLVAIALCFGSGIYGFGSSKAQAQDLNCSDFGTKQQAQDELEADPSDPNNLDADDDGEACEEGVGGGTTQQETIPPPPPQPPLQPPAPLPVPVPDSGPLFKAGGSEDGPVPLMRGDACPKEFPNRRGNACYPAR